MFHKFHVTRVASNGVLLPLRDANGICGFLVQRGLKSSFGLWNSQKNMGSARRLIPKEELCYPGWHDSARHHRLAGLNWQLRLSLNWSWALKELDFPPPAFSGRSFRSVESLQQIFSCDSLIFDDPWNPCQLRKKLARN